MKPLCPNPYHIGYSPYPLNSDTLSVSRSSVKNDNSLFGVSHCCKLYDID